MSRNSESRPRGTHTDPRARAPPRRLASPPRENTIQPPPPFTIAPPHRARVAPRARARHSRGESIKMTTIIFAERCVQPRVARRTTRRDRSIAKSASDASSERARVDRRVALSVAAAGLALGPGAAHAGKKLSGGPTGGVPLEYFQPVRGDDADARLETDEGVVRDRFRVRTRRFCITT